MKFLDDYPFEKRLQESERIKNKYPERIPVIINIDNTNTFRKNVPDMEKIKYLFPSDSPVASVLVVARKRMKISEATGLFVFIHNENGKDVIPQTNQSMKDLYNKYKNKDGFLYLIITGENVFG